jgi:hypothetical protein
VDAILIEPGMMGQKSSKHLGRRGTTICGASGAGTLLPPCSCGTDRAFEKTGADDPQVVVDAVIKAVSQEHANPIAIIGKGTSVLMMLSHLPVRTRGKLAKNARSFGILKAI